MEIRGTVYNMYSYLLDWLNTIQILFLVLSIFFKYFSFYNYGNFKIFVVNNF